MAAATPAAKTPAVSGNKKCPKVLKLTHFSVHFLSLFCPDTRPSFIAPCGLHVGECPCGGPEKGHRKSDSHLAMFATGQGQWMN